MADCFARVMYEVELIVRFSMALITDASLRMDKERLEIGKLLWKYCWRCRRTDDYSDGSRNKRYLVVERMLL